MKTAALLKNINNDMRDIEIVSGDNLIGRNPLKNDIVINHQSISSQHAIITFNDNRECHIKDVSSNGTFLNGRRLPRDVDILIKNNDVIRFGKDHSMYKLFVLPYKENDKVKLVNSSQSARVDHFKRIDLDDEDKVNIDSKEYKVLEAKHRALMQYASDITRRNDDLENNLKESKESLKKESEEKENEMKRLKEENSYLRSELDKIALFFTENKIFEVSISDYIKEIAQLKETFYTLKKEMDNKYKALYEIVQSDSLKTNNILNKINSLYTSVDNRKEIGNQLISSIKEILSSKESLLKENISMKKQIDLYTISNHIKPTNNFVIPTRQSVNTVSSSIDNLRIIEEISKSL